MNDNARAITPLQLAVAAAIDSYDRVTCAEVADRASEQLRYQPSPADVSRVLAGWGWTKKKIDGVAGFVRPPNREGDARCT